MKPYDFYKKKFELLHPDKERIQKYNENDNYDFPFFAGKDANGHRLNMKVLINRTADEPTDRAIKGAQKKALNSLYAEIMANLNNGQYKEMHDFIESMGKEYENIIKDEQYTQLKKMQTQFNTDFKDHIAKYTIDTKEKDEAKLESIIKDKLDEIDYDQCKKDITILTNQYNELAKLLEGLSESILKNKDIPNGIVNWNELCSIKNKLAEQLQSLQELDGSNKFDFKNKIEYFVKTNSLKSYHDAINYAANFFSGWIGEYVATIAFEAAANKHNKKGKKWLDIINAGNLLDPSDTKQLRVDHIIVTEENKGLELDLNINGTDHNKIRLENLNSMLNGLEKKAKASGSKISIVVKNWDELMRNNKLAGYTIQTKFRKDPMSIMNYNDASKYSINQLLEETEGLGGQFSRYAKYLDLFVRWYEASNKYWEPVTKGPYHSRVSATYISEKPSTEVYTRYFNYLLSRTEAIKKIYTPSLFWYLTVGGGFSLEYYITEKMKQANNAMISARSPVDLNKPNKLITVNVGSSIPTYEKE